MVTTLIILALSMIFFINGKLRSDMAALCAFVSNTGAPPNLVIRETLAQAGFNDISFFSFTPVGIVCLATGLLVLIPLSKKILQKKDDKKSKTDAPLRSPKALTQFTL
jgi:predicted permease